jgi:hypothetical protein
MTRPFSFDANRMGSALVIVFPPEVRGLFNAEIHGLVRDVEQQLEGVFVTYALSSSGSPDLRDALAAARFAGCDSAVVVPAGETDVAQEAEHGPSGDWMLAPSPILADVDAPAVVDAYQAALAEAEKAA